MKCSACQATLSEGARFCAQCATPVPVQKPDADPVRDALAKALGTHYRIVRLLGRGGMGAVYLAHEDGLDRDVAIKALPPDRAGSTEIRERFRREARTAARLTHPNVVPLHTFGEVAGTMYYVMGYVPGHSLAARLASEGPLPELEAKRLLAEIAGALAYAHQQGVVHRDIKPDNILLEEGSGRPLLTDFGIAKAVAGEESLTSTGSIIGTPSYMSPEQASGKGEVDARSDLYSLGVMAYAMLAGRLPFQGKTSAEVILQHMTRAPAPLASVAPLVSATLAAAVMRCLEKDPAARWAQAGDLVAALRSQTDDPDALPNELEHVDGGGLQLSSFLCYGLLIAVWGMYFGRLVPQYVGVRPFSFGPGPYFFAILIVAMSVVIAAPSARAIALCRRRGFSWSEIVRAAFRQPVGWPLFYPRSLRRPSNVWDRLPAPARITRSVWTTAFVVFALALPPFLWAGAYSGDFPRAARNVETVQAVALYSLLFAALSAFGVVLWAKRVLRNATLERSLLTDNFLLRAPLSATGFWTRPEVRTLLAPLEREQANPKAISPKESPATATEAPTLQR